jgi:hypothetical protein
VLKQSQVDAGGIVVIQLPQSSFSEQLGYLPHGSGEQEGVIHHDPEVLLDGKIDELFALGNIAGERLLDKDVFAVLQRGLRQLIVRPHRSNDGDSIDVGRFNNFHRVRRDMDARIGLMRTLLRIRAKLRDGRNLRTLETGEVSNYIGSPVAVADYTEIHRIVTTLSALLTTA